MRTPPGDDSVIYNSSTTRGSVPDRIWLYTKIDLPLTSRRKLVPTTRIVTSRLRFGSARPPILMMESPRTIVVTARPRCGSARSLILTMESPSKNLLKRSLRTQMIARLIVTVQK